MTSTNAAHLPSDRLLARYGGRVRRLHLGFGLTFPGKYTFVNDGDLDHGGQGDGMPDWADGFNGRGASDNRDVLMLEGPNTDPNLHRFVPIRFTLPAHHHGDVRFWLEYDAADPVYLANYVPGQPLASDQDPRDMRHWWNQETGHHYELGLGSARLWKKQAHEAREGQYLDSTELNTATGLQEKVYYTHSDFGLTEAGGVVTLYLEAVRPSTAEGGHSVTLHAVFAAEHTSGGQTVSIPAHSYVEIKKATITAVRVNLMVDSFNDSGFNVPPLGHSDDEDALENYVNLPGKLIAINDGDIDDDGVIDWADFDGIAGAKFVPLRLVLPSLFDLTGAMISFDYAASDPNGITGTGTLMDPYVLPPSSGQAPEGLRIWTKDAHEARDPLPVILQPPYGTTGDFVLPGEEIDVDVLFAGGAREVTLLVEAVRLSEALGDQRIEVVLSLDSAANPWLGNVQLPSDALRLTAKFEVNVLVDTNRDNKIDQDDELQKAEWSRTRGAIILPNADDDDGNGVPDNWAGGDWDLLPGDEAADKVIGPNGDLDDIGPLWVRRFGFDALPDNLVVKLRVSSVAGIPGEVFFNHVAPNKRIRVFIPTEVDGDDLKVKVGDTEVLGPDTAETVEFVKSPNATQQGYDLFKGKGIIKFGVEGIDPGSYVDIELAAELGGIVIASDTVRVRVAPFVLNDHRQQIVAGGPTAVFVEDVGAANDDVRAKLAAQFGANLGAGVLGDQWHQDGYEIGYAEAPYGQMLTTLELLRSHARGASLQKFIRTSILQKDLAVITPFSHPSRAFTISTFDSGGNIESLPKPGGGPGYFFHGKHPVHGGMSDEQITFFTAQAVNDPLAVDTTWLTVGHVDEVVSLSPDGTKVMVADPEGAWALMLWAAKVDAAAIMNQDMPAGSPGRAVGDVVSDLALRSWNMDVAMDAAHLPSVRNTVAGVMGVSAPETTPVPDAANTGAASLSKGGALVGFFGNANAREYQIEFTDADNYQLRFREVGGSWSAWVAGRRDQDEVFPDARAFILRHWWTGGAPAGGDKFTFGADPGAGMVEVPVLFDNVPAPGRPNAVAAYTTNFINSLVSGITVITGDAYGPSVDWAGNGASDILKDYTDQTFVMAGISNIVRADGRFYHNGIGFIHCGTNVVRQLPTDKWWDH